MDSSQIITLDFEDLDNAYLSTWEDVWSEIKRRTTSAPKHYIFLDEVQRIAGYEKLVDGLFARKGYDVYITGSNAYMLSSEISTLLSGRYVEIQIHPLSFREYWMALGQPDVLRTYQQYVQTGGFPHLVSFGNDATMVHDYLAAIYQTILLKDILTRKSFRDVSTLTRVARFLFDNIGNLTNARKISDTLSSANCKTSFNTIEAYLAALCETYLIYHVSRYDIKGKDLLKSGGKYYVADLGLRRYLLGIGGDEGHLLENIVFLELLRRNKHVYIGKLGATEVDFVTQNEDDIRYYQVALSVRSPETLERELRPLQQISDNYPKFLLTLDYAPPLSHNGIQQLFVLDWLLQDPLSPHS